MEQRHTLSGPTGQCGFVRWSARQALPWLCLLTVVSTSAYELQGTAAAIAPTASAAPDRDRPAMNAAVDAASVSSGRTVVLITGYDATTGDRMQVQCVTDSDRLASDALLVDLNELGHIAAKVCVSGAD
jgi:hypothetical protein